MALNVALYTITSKTVDATEYSITNDSTTIASKTDVSVIAIEIDTSAMAAGDEYEIAIREKVVSSGSQYRRVLANLVGAQPDPFFASGFFVGVGWDVTIQKIAGTDRAFSASIRSA